MVCHVPSASRRKDSNAPPEACVEVLASVVRPEAVESKVFRTAVLAFRRVLLLFRSRTYGIAGDFRTVSPHYCSIS